MLLQLYTRLSGASEGSHSRTPRSAGPSCCCCCCCGWSWLMAAAAGAAGAVLVLWWSLAPFGCHRAAPQPWVSTPSHTRITLAAPRVAPAAVSVVWQGDHTCPALPSHHTPLHYTQVTTLPGHHTIPRSPHTAQYPGHHTIPRSLLLHGGHHTILHHYHHKHHTRVSHLPVHTLSIYTLTTTLQQHHTSHFSCCFTITTT